MSKEHANTQGSRKGYNLHIYKDGEEIPGSPFNSYREGGKAIGLASVSSICNYINTGKVFKDGYTFFSSPTFCLGLWCFLYSYLNLNNNKNEMQSKCGLLTSKG